MIFRTIPRCEECGNGAKMEPGKTYMVYLCQHGKAVLADTARKDLLPTNEAVEFLVNQSQCEFTGVQMPVLEPGAPMTPSKESPNLIACTPEEHARIHAGELSPLCPSKEPLQAAREIRAQLGIACEAAPLATLIDTAYAEHRERVKRLVEAAQMADDFFTGYAVNPHGVAARIGVALSDALAALKEPSQ